MNGFRPRPKVARLTLTCALATCAKVFTRRPKSVRRNVKNYCCPEHGWAAKRKAVG
jgi:predicted RNA-binding Zn-ribbon protein involved in translation (DUF1610 family)